MRNTETKQKSGGRLAWLSGLLVPRPVSPSAGGKARAPAPAGGAGTSEDLALRHHRTAGVHVDAALYEIGRLREEIAGLMSRRRA